MLQRGTLNKCVKVLIKRQPEDLLLEPYTIYSEQSATPCSCYPFMQNFSSKNWSSCLVVTNQILSFLIFIFTEKHPQPYNYLTCECVWMDGLCQLAVTWMAESRFSKQHIARYQAHQCSSFQLSGFNCVIYQFRSACWQEEELPQEVSAAEICGCWRQDVF